MATECIRIRSTDTLRHYITEEKIFLRSLPETRKECDKKLEFNLLLER